MSNWTVHPDVLSVTQSTVAQKKEKMKAGASWGFHELVCYHILIMKAPLCLHPFCNLSGALLWQTKHIHATKITH